MPNAVSHRTVSLLGVAMLSALACLCGNGTSTGAEALEACEVTPIHQVLPGATLVSASCQTQFNWGATVTLHMKAPATAMLAGGAERLPKPTKLVSGVSDDQRVGVCGLLIDDSPEEREATRASLRAEGMALPPPNAEYSTWRTSKPVIGWGGTSGFGESTLEMLRAGEDVWITVSQCAPG